MMWGRIYIFSLILLSSGFLLPQHTHAVSDSFTIRSAIIGNDTTPPTTPSIISATPITSTQIDILWAAVTDDLAVGGYQVFRDAVQVATTTLLSFSDTGLVASTTYTYTIRAFDTSNNFSTTSAGVSATTPTPVIEEPVTTTGGRRLISEVIELVTLHVLTDTNSATLKWETSEFSRFSLRWGRTTNYEFGYVQSEALMRDHTTTISNLDADTKYEYELTAYDRFGTAYILARDQFTTESGPDTVAPANVSNLQAAVVGEAVRLSWSTPSDADFSHVSVVRSHYFYPTHPTEGFLVYTGSAAGALDTSPFTFGPNAFYTVFAYDTSGNRSSGAVVLATNLKSTGSEDTKEDDIDEQLSSINFSDVQFIQDDIVRNERDTEIQIDGAKPLTIKIPYTLLPRHLKSIVVSFTHPSNEQLTFSFLLRINKDSTAYEATVAPFFEEGMFSVRVAVFDYEHQDMTEVSGVLRVSYDPARVPDALRDVSMYSWAFLVLVGTLSLLVIIFFFFLFARRRDEGEAT